jgi:hypothetical protein
MFENRELRSIFGPKRDEVTGVLRKLHDEELYDLYSSPYCVGDKIEKNEIGGVCSSDGEGRGMYRVCGGET